LLDRFENSISDSRCKSLNIKNCSKKCEHLTHFENGLYPFIAIKKHLKTSKKPPERPVRHALKVLGMCCGGDFQVFPAIPDIKIREMCFYQLRKQLSFFTMAVSSSKCNGVDDI